MGVAGLAALTWSGGAQAADGVMVCDGCTLMQTNAAARAKAPGYVYVVDFETPRVRLFYTEKAPDGVVTLESMPVAPAVTRLFTDIDGAIDADQVLDITVEINEGEGFTGDYFVTNPLAPFENQGYGAFNVVTNATLRSRIAIAFENRLDVGNAALDQATELFNDLLNEAYNFAFEKDFALIVEVKWDDGSTTKFRVTADGAEYMLGESTDADGNPFPDASLLAPGGEAQFMGEHHFSSQATYDDWAAAMQFYGIPVSTGGGPFPTGTVTVCTIDASTGRLRCM